VRKEGKEQKKREKEERTERGRKVSPNKTGFAGTKATDKLLISPLRKVSLKMEVKRTAPRTETTTMKVT
jgi:hypothetical protein